MEYRRGRISQEYRRWGTPAMMRLHTNSKAIQRGSQKGLARRISSTLAEHGRDLLRAIRGPMGAKVQTFEFFRLVAREPAVHGLPADAPILCLLVTVRPSAITATTALYLCSVTLISLVLGSAKAQPN